MKIKKIITVVILFVFFIQSCELIYDKDTTGSISNISVFPIFDLEGGSIMTIVKGTSFTDPGYVASEVSLGESDLSVTVKGSVDSNTTGAYILTYIATNSHGYTDSAFRTILVHEPPYIIHDLVGRWKFSSYYMNISETEIPGFFQASNINKADRITAYFAYVGGNEYVIASGAYEFSDERGKYVGTATLTPGTPDKITFSFDMYEDHDDGASIHRNRIWTKQ